MADTPQRLPRTLWIGLIFFLAVLCLAYALSLMEINRTHLHALPVLNPVAEFTLTNQDNKVVTLADLSDHVWIADIIFTRCAGSCPVMSQKMKSLQDKLASDSRVKLVTLTTDPDYDTPAVMKKYGERYRADFDHWMFLTGSKKEIGGLATGSLKLDYSPVKAVDQKDANDLFVHSTIFVVVDGRARLRGIFQTEGEGIDWANVQPQILAAVYQLERAR